MNDFTKEELQYMAEAIDMWFKGFDGELPEKIYLKLKSMIDNYCEHELTTGCPTCAHISDFVCVKCDKEF